MTNDKFIKMNQEKEIILSEGVGKYPALHDK